MTPNKLTDHYKILGEEKRLFSSCMHSFSKIGSVDDLMIWFDVIWWMCFELVNVWLIDARSTGSVAFLY